MKTRAKSFITITILIMCLGTTACGNTSKDYTVTKVKNSYTYHTEYTFDTTKFDQNKFDDKLLIGDVEVTLPFLSINDLTELGVEVTDSTRVFSRNEIDSNMTLYREDKMEPLSGDLIGWFYCGQFREEGFSTDLIMGTTAVYNGTEEELSVLDCEIGNCYFEMLGQSDVKQVMKMLGVEGEEFKLDNLIERFGVPFFYFEDEDMILCYYYGDYSLLFWCGNNSSDSEYIRKIRYLSTNYLNYLEEHDRLGRYKDFKDACNKYNR